MIWAGSPFAQLVEFTSGQPIGVVSYELLGNNGTTLSSGSVALSPGAVSVVIAISGDLNTCDLPLFENRTLLWNYLTAEGQVSERETYRVARPIPFAASPEGVRQKLGIERHEISDKEIDLVSAYADILEMGDLTPYAISGNRNTLLCIHAIEAMAALALLPALQVKIAQIESGGTNEFKRYAKVDWATIQRELEMHVARARELLDPTFDGVGLNVFLFGKITPTPDVITAV